MCAIRYSGIGPSESMRLCHSVRNIVKIWVTYHERYICRLCTIPLLNFVITRCSTNKLANINKYMLLYSRVVVTCRYSAIACARYIMYDMGLRDCWRYGPVGRMWEVVVSSAYGFTRSLPAWWWCFWHLCGWLTVCLFATVSGDCAYRWMNSSASKNNEYILR